MPARIVVALLLALLPALITFSAARADGGGGGQGDICCVWDAQADSTCPGYEPGSNGCFHSLCDGESAYIDGGNCVIHVVDSGSEIDCRYCSLFAT